MRKKSVSFKILNLHVLLITSALILSVFSLKYVSENNRLIQQLRDYNNIYAEGSTFYVDCTTGNDTNNGTTAATAWRSLNKASNANLGPGDKLVFKRGCTWSGRLSLGWKGTSAAPITVSDYGTGALPIIQADPSISSSRVEINGSYLLIENLEIKTINPRTDPQCKNQTIGYYVGFNLLGSSSFNTIRNNKIHGHTIGVHITDNSHHNKIQNNEIFDNGVMNQLTPDSSPDLGAWGMNLRGDDNDISGNYFHDNNGVCAYDFSIRPGNAIEIYNGDRNNIHHNKVVNDRVFSEVGHNGTHTSDNNVWAYNVYYSNTPTSRFLVLHNANNQFGPVNGSKVYNNSIYLYGPSSTGIGGGDPTTIVKNNILVATAQLMSTSGTQQANNIFWNPNGSPAVSSLGTQDRKIDPQYVNPGAGNLHIKSTSPAINTGTAGSGFTTDFDGLPTPSGQYDIGAYEYYATAPGTLPPSASPSPSIPSNTCANPGSFSITQPSGYTFTKDCMKTGSTLYTDDSRFTYFGVPDYLRYSATVKTGNIAEKGDLSLSFGIHANAQVKVYVMYRKIPGQSVPSWLSSGYIKKTPEGYENLPQFVLRKNDLGLIGVYDIYERSTVLSTGQNATFGPASDQNTTAFSMYLVSIIPQ